jgi:quercetin dioxygenase-like cupin family protein
MSQEVKAMKDFPGFMKNRLNLVPAEAQNTEDIEGYYFEGKDGSQMAYWTCYADRESKKHKHDFDEYTVVVAGRYTACFEDGREIVLQPGDELFVPAGTLQWGRSIAGTRTIHAFGGRRIR